MKLNLTPLAWLAPALLIGCQAAGSAPAEPSKNLDGPVYFIGGAVEQPRICPLFEDTSLMEVVLESRPVEGRADLTQVLLVRTSGDDPLVLRGIDVRRMLESGDTTANVLIEDGDVIRVPERQD